jgi:6-phosphogluconolactonase (cycloisomerase 2 family)
MKKINAVLMTAAAGALALTACGPKYTVGGTLTGLGGSGLVLQDNAGDDLSIDANGSFAFSTGIAKGGAYAVTVAAQPTNPAQQCVVHNGTGTIDKAAVTHVIVSCSQPGTFAFVTDRTSNDVAAFAIDASSGALTPVPGSPFGAGGTAPAAVAVDWNRQYLYVVNSTSNTVAVFTIDAGTGALGEVGTPVATGGGPVAVYIEPSDQYLYVANRGDGTISAYSIDPSTGSLTSLAGSPFTAGTGTAALQTDPGGNFLYAANAGASDVAVFSIDPASGVLAGIAGSPFAAGVEPVSLAVDPGGAHAYVADGTGNGITAFAIDAATGALTPVSGSPFTTGSSSATSIAVDPAGSHVYAADASRVNQVAVFAIEPSTGALMLDETIGAGALPAAVAVDPSGNFVYVANQDAGDVSVYATASGAGTLTAVSVGPFTAGAGPVAIAID